MGFPCQWPRTLFATFPDAVHAFGHPFKTIPMSFIECLRASEEIWRTAHGSLLNKHLDITRWIVPRETPHSKLASSRGVCSRRALVCHVSSAQSTMIA